MLVTQPLTLFSQIMLPTHAPMFPVSHAQLLYESGVISTWTAHSSQNHEHGRLTTWILKATRPSWLFYKFLLRPYLFGQESIQADLYTAQLIRLYSSLRNTSSFQVLESRLWKVEIECLHSLDFGDTGKGVPLPRGISGWKEDVLERFCALAGRVAKEDGVLGEFVGVVEGVLKGL